MEIEAADREALAFIAEGAGRLSGFGVIAISVVDDGILHTVAVAGDDEARLALASLRPPVAAVLRELEHAESWGMLKFVAHDRAPGHLEGLSWIPSTEATHDPHDWHPHDLLCALLRDESGRLRGLLSMDLPHDGRRPDDAQRVILDAHAHQAERAVITALDRSHLARSLAHERDLADYRRTMTDSLTHELKNSVGSITSATELLREQWQAGGSPTGDGDRLLSILDRGGRRLTALIDDISLLGRLESAEDAVGSEAVCLSDLVRDACALATADAEVRAIRVDCAVADGLMVRGEPRELDQMITNLVSNAVKYSDDGGLVQITLRAVPAPDSHAEGTGDVELRVADHGIGISADDRRRLFDEFFRSSSQEARARPGTGLGLAIVHRVVARHSGRIEVESEVGRGSTFTVVIGRA